MSSVLGSSVVCNAGPLIADFDESKRIDGSGITATCQPASEWYGFPMHSRIQIDPNTCHGKPVIKGTRVLVSTILGALSGGDVIETLLEDYPNITREDVEAALEFASRLSDYQESAYEAVA